MAKFTKADKNRKVETPASAHDGAGMSARTRGIFATPYIHHIHPKKTKGSTPEKDTRVSATKQYRDSIQQMRESIAKKPRSTMHAEQFQTRYARILGNVNKETDLFHNFMSGILSKCKSSSSQKHIIYTCFETFMNEEKPESYEREMKFVINQLIKHNICTSHDLEIILAHLKTAAVGAAAAEKMYTNLIKHVEAYDVKEESKEELKPRAP